MGMVDDDGRPPLEGEIVGPVPLLPGDDDRRKERRYYDEDLKAAAVRARALGATLKQVGERFGVSHETVRIWTGEAVKNRRAADADIDMFRARMAVEFESLEHEAQRLVFLYPGTELALKAITVAAKIKSARANLLGAVAPARVHVDLTQVDTADAELQEMIATARAKSQAQIDKIRKGFTDGKQ